MEQKLTLNNKIRNINPVLENCEIKERWSEFCEEVFLIYRMIYAVPRLILLIQANAMIHFLG